MLAIVLSTFATAQQISPSISDEMAQIKNLLFL